MNDGMDDFAVPGTTNAYGIPPSPANFIKPKKMPLSSMCPSILLDENQNVEIALGAAGGSKITSSVAYVRYFNLIFPLFTILLIFSNLKHNAYLGFATISVFQ